MRFFAIIISLAFLCASMGLCEEADGASGTHEDSHRETHHCIASCSAACCKSLIQDDGFTVPPSFTAASVFISAQNIYCDLVVRSIKHPPKTLS